MCVIPGACIHHQRVIRVVNHRRAGVLVTTFTKKKMENENSDYVCLEYELNRKISNEDFENHRVYNFLKEKVNNNL